ncbi:MAG: hypothetical protein WAO56_07620, partial [Miniphocaeibacter sp.]
FGLSAQAVIFLLGAIAPVNGVGFAKRGDFFDPLQQSFVIRFHDDSVFCWELRLSKTSVKRCNLSPEGGGGQEKTGENGTKP